MVDADGFVEVASNGQKPTLACPGCDRSDFASLSGLKSHWRRKHPEQPDPDWSQVSSGTAQTDWTSMPEVERPRAMPPPVGASRDMKVLQAELTESIAGLGAIIAAVLGSYKEATLTAEAKNGRPIEVRGRQLPYIESTFGHVVATRAPLSAKILCQYAESNSTLYALLEGFNRVMHGGEAGQLVAAHAVGLAHTIAPQNQRINQAAMMFAGDAVQKVMEENEYLRHKLAAVMLNREDTVAYAGMPDDERGAGN